jgi:uncharacterized membrane protein
MSKSRLPALDVMRGVVMILMTVDHASEAFNSGRLITDSVMFWKRGTVLPPAQFLTRWITHLCAPTFVLLAGTSLALSTESRARRGDTPADIDRHLAIRGGLLIALDLAWMSPALLEPGRILCQVLYALGASFLFMVPLRRLSDRALLGVGLGLVVLCEPILFGLSTLGVARTLPAALLLAGGIFADGRVIIAYPALEWLGIMCMGWVLGRKLLAWPEGERAERAARVLLPWGAALLVIFGVVRGANSFGNMGLLREDGTLVQWLHVSKYPPSIAYDGLELGIAALMLAGLFVVCAKKPDFAAPVRTLGQVALFYYLLHIHLMKGVAELAGVHAKLGLASAYVGAAGALLVLAPACAWYRRYKAENPGGWRQYV